MLYIVIFTCIAINLATSAAGDPNYKIVIYNQTTEFNTDYGNVSIDINNGIYNFSAFIFHKLKTMSMDMQINISTKTDKRVDRMRTLFSKTLDFCEFFANPQFDPISNIVFQRKIANKKNFVFSKCPILPVSIILSFLIP